MKRSIPGYRPNGYWLVRFIEAARKQGGVLTVGDIELLTGYPRQRAANVIVQQALDGWWERSSTSTYKMTPKAEAYQGPLWERVVACCNAGPSTAKSVAEALGIAPVKASDALRILKIKRRIRSIERGVYGGLQTQEEVARAAE
jgi:predicted transcriptional regulator of viral defense system